MQLLRMYANLLLQGFLRFAFSGSLSQVCFLRFALGSLYYLCHSGVLDSEIFTHFLSLRKLVLHLLLASDFFR